LVLGSFSPEMEAKGKVLAHLVYFLLFAYFASRVAVSMVKLQGQSLPNNIRDKTKLCI
jgi:hypothetical protein